MGFDVVGSSVFIAVGAIIAKTLDFILRKQSNQTSADDSLRQDLMQLLQIERQHYTKEHVRLLQEINDLKHEKNANDIKYNQLLDEFNALKVEVNNLLIIIDNLKAGSVK